jgi:hypothetical protein
VGRSQTKNLLLHNKQNEKPPKEQETYCQTIQVVNTQNNKELPPLNTNKYTAE